MRSEIFRRARREKSDRRPALSTRCRLPLAATGPRASGTRMRAMIYPAPASKPSRSKLGV